jgi:threonine dehydrogenase-like Zn-dependent dehydrogenase
MRAAIFKGPGLVEVGERPAPAIQEPDDAVVRVVRGCVCGSDLWYYRGVNPHAVGSIGHEFIGVVEAVGAAVTGLAVGDFVIAPFTYSDGTSAAARSGTAPPMAARARSSVCLPLWPRSSRCPVRASPTTSSPRSRRCRT